MTSDDALSGPVPGGPAPAAPEPFPALLAAARAVAERAYAPYSGYRVGAAALADDGRTVAGCNVENAGYGVTLCAECGLISDLIAGGGGRITHFVCVNGPGEVIMPCGRCRQLLAEHAAAGFTILTPAGTRDLEGLLPQSFAAADIDAGRDR